MMAQGDRLPAALPELEQTRGSICSSIRDWSPPGVLTGLTQTGGLARSVGGNAARDRTQHDPGMRRSLMVWVGLSGILGRFSSPPDRAAGTPRARTLACGMAALLMVLQGYFTCLYRYLVASPLVSDADLFRSAIYTVVGPYMSEIWPAGCAAAAWA